MEENTKSKMNEGLFSSRTEEWETPQYVFDWLSSQFNFTLDVCATRDNTKCKKFYSKAEDGLKQNWYFGSQGGDVFMNPPYGRDIHKWMCKALEESESYLTVVCLVHARTDTKWFHNYAMKADEIWFIKGRLKFGDSKQAAPFPSCIVIFRPSLGERKSIYNTPLIKSVSIDKNNKTYDIFQ